MAAIAEPYADQAPPDTGLPPGRRAAVFRSEALDRLARSDPAAALVYAVLALQATAEAEPELTVSRLP